MKLPPPHPLLLLILFQYKQKGGGGGGKPQTRINKQKIQQESHNMHKETVAAQNASEIRKVFCCA